MKHDSKPSQSSTGAGATPESRPGPAGQGLQSSLVGKPYAQQAELVRPKPEVRGKGDEGRQADPALKHQVTAPDPHRLDPERGEERSQEAAGFKNEKVNGKRLPYEGAALKWDAAAILSYWSQIDNSGATKTDASRCAANAAMASRIDAGPFATERYALAIAGEGEAKLAKEPKPKRKLAMQKAIGRCRAAAKAVGEGLGTYAHLDDIADAIAQCMTAKPADGTTFQEAEALHGKDAQRGGGDDDRDLVPKSRADVSELCLRRLQPGEAWLVLVDLNKPEPGVAPNPDQGNHYVTVGARRDRPVDLANVYLYDPWPRAGSQMITATDPDFWAYFGIDRAGKAQKFATFVSRTKPLG